MHEINLVMPMGGAGSRFSKNGFTVPKPLIKLHNKPFFYWATRSVTDFVNVKELIFVVQEEHCKSFHIDREILKYFPEARIVTLSKVLKGALLSGLEGAALISNKAPIIFNDCDHLFRCKKLYDYCNLPRYKNGIDLDGAILTFNSVDSKYSYAKISEDGLVTKTVEKKVISNRAICGVYFFKDRDMLSKTASDYLDSCPYSEYYFSGLYNIMISRGLNIGHFDVETHVSFGTPEEYQSAIENTFFDEVL